MVGFGSIYHNERKYVGNINLSLPTAFFIPRMTESGVWFKEDGSYELVED